MACVGAQAPLQEVLPMALGAGCCCCCCCSCCCRCQFDSPLRCSRCCCSAPAHQGVRMRPRIRVCVWTSDAEFSLAPVHGCSKQNCAMRGPHAVFQSKPSGLRWRHRSSVLRRPGPRWHLHKLTQARSPLLKRNQGVRKWEFE